MFNIKISKSQAITSSFRLKKGKEKKEKSLRTIMYLFLYPFMIQ